jgi:transposase InsO family protein
LNISKQAVHQARKRQQRFDLELMDLVNQADIIREDHPGCGVEKMYKALKPKFMGRDKFCEIFMDLGFRVRTLKNYRRTTIPTHLDYPNLIKGMEVTKPHQVLQSDITYFYLNEKFYYIVFILDVYTKKIIGYNVSKNLRHESNLNALKMALKEIEPESRVNMIHHSDRGSQYGSNAYVKLLNNSGIIISMGLKAQENAYAERINGTIKNEYLKLWKIKDFKDLKAKTRKAVNHYNYKRGHSSLPKDLAPNEFEEYLLNLKNQERPTVIIYADGNYKVKVASSHHDFITQERPLAHNCPIIIKDE